MTDQHIDPRIAELRYEIARRLHLAGWSTSQVGDLYGDTLTVSDPRSASFDAGPITVQIIIKDEAM